MTDDTAYLHPEDGRICRLDDDDVRRFGRGGWGDSRRWECKREHSVQPDRWPILAVLPGPYRAAKSVHLLLPGYQGPKPPPTRRREAGSHQAFCGSIGVSTLHWNITTEVDEPTGREHVPMSAAESIVRSSLLRWCPLCLGRAITHVGVASEAARLVVEADLRPT